MKTILTLLSLTISTFISGQNLVPNPSFEMYAGCPSIFGELTATPWIPPTWGTPDYFNVCSGSGNYVGIPLNWFGNQNARTGDAYAGFIAIEIGYNYREYIQVQLTSPLQTGIKYYANFYVSLGDSSLHTTDDFGLYFSTTAIYAANNSPLPYVPQIINTPGNFITDKNYWHLISGTFIANGGEQYITIGNFKNDLNTDTLHISPNGLWNIAYYFIDDICISTDSLPCFPLGIDDQTFSPNTKLCPNPFSQTTTFEFENPTKEKCSLTLYDTYGRIVQTIANITSDKVEIERNNLAGGIYFIHLTQGNKVIATKKLVIVDI